MTLSEKRQSLLDELAPFDDPHERFRYIIDRAKTAPSLEERYKVPELLIRGCTSNLWVLPRYESGACFFQADADSIISKGIATLVCEFYSGATPGEVLGTEADFLGTVGITQHLSPNRRNGLSNLVVRIRAFAGHCAAPAVQ
ncbi:MAG: SufE family protein [Puniceicoccales bacterium]|jgi:cysteine desulfuration protein SufE|nr:SufE family protein [Puniceicoccales bacterium]